MKINTRNFIDYTLLLLVLAISGFPYFSTSVLYIPVFILLLSIYFFRKRKLDKIFIVLLLLIVIIILFQSHIFNFFSLRTISGVIFRVAIAYLIVKILKTKFTLYFVNILYYLAIISLFFYVPIILFPQLKVVLLGLVPFFEIMNIADSAQRTIILFNIQLHHLSMNRNPGPFWEPGAFAGYLMLAIIFNSVQQNPKQNKKTIILVITLITTFSTTAYLGLFVFYFLFFYDKIQNYFLKILVSIFLLSFGYWTYFSVDFIGNKIEHQLKLSKGVNPYYGNTNTQRFLNILRDYEDFKGHEIFGRGSNPITRYSVHLEDQIRTVGLTDIIVRMGLPFFIFIMFLLFNSICGFVNYHSYNKKTVCIGIFLTILIMLMSEVYFLFPIYWCLLFLHLVFKPRISHQI